MAEEAKKSGPKAEKTEKAEVKAETEKKPGDETSAEAKKPTKKRSKKKKALTDGRIYIHASYNNTIITVTDQKGNPACWSSAGGCGFKGTRKSTPYAAQVASETAANKAKQLGLERANVYVKGVGIGRDQALRALAAAAIDLQSITDLTPLPHGGVRPRKARRV